MENLQTTLFILINVAIYHKSADRFNQVLSYSDLRLCQALREPDASSITIPFVKTMLQSFKDIDGEFPVNIDPA